MTIHSMHFRKNSPASERSIHAFKVIAKHELPEAYLKFLLQSNGGEGFIGHSSYIILWAIEDLIKMNESYQVDEYAPGLFLFGSDGGGEAYAFDLRSNSKPIVSVPFVGMDLSLVQFVAINFDEFLQNLAAS